MVEQVDDSLIDVCAPDLLAVTPLVSVQMLAYRHGKFLAQAIEGVLAQKCDFPFELVIAEDCSPDDSLRIALTYQQAHPAIIRVIYGKRNVGMHDNAWRATSFCRGRYFAQCEGDDYWHDATKLAQQVALLESAPDMVLCHTDFDRLTRFRHTRNVHRGKAGRYRPAVGHAYHDLLFTWSVMTATTVYRRQVVQDFGESRYYSKNWPFGDLNLLLYASLQGRIGYIDCSTATFRKMRGSAGNNGIEAALRMQLAAEECVEFFLAHHPVPDMEWREIIASRKKSIYMPAYFARRLDVMNECYNWLLENDYMPSRMQHTLRLLAVKLVLPHWIDVRLRQFITNHLSAISA